MPGATRSIVIDAPAEKVFDVITDYDRYAEFLPEVKQVQSSGRKGNEVDVAYGIDLVKRIRYTLHMVEERPKSGALDLRQGRADEGQPRELDAGVVAATARRGRRTPSRWGWVRWCPARS